MKLREGEFWSRERWPATIATLIAIALYYASNGPNPIVPALIIVWLLGYFISQWFILDSRVMWVVRLVIYIVIYTTTIDRDTNLTDTIIYAPWMSVFAQWAIAEFALRRWRKGLTPLWADILPSTVIMLAGCSTQDALYVTFLAPLYFLFLVLAFAQIGHRAHAALSWRWINLSVRVACLLIALAIGGFAHYCFHQYKSEILTWGSNVLGDHATQAMRAATISGIDKSPALGPTFGSSEPATRLLLIHGDLQDPYIRGMSYETYTHGAWAPLPDARKYHGVTRQSLLHPCPLPADRIDIERLVPDDGMVSFPLTTASMVLESPAEISWATIEGGPLKVNYAGVLTYHCVVPRSSDYQGLASVPPSGIDLRRMLLVPPEVNPGVVALARRVVDGRKGVSAVRVIERFLIHNNRYSDRTNPGEGDPLSEFVLDRKSANCQYFASAATIMLRSVGIPTRFVIGYYAHEGNADGLVVRAEDAHAWAESYVSGVGWVTVDATPPSGRPDSTARLTYWWELRDRLDDISLYISGAWNQLNLVQQCLTLVGIGGGAILLYAIRVWGLTRRPGNFNYRYAHPDAAVLALERRFDRFMQAHNATCPSSVTWREHIEIVSQHDSSIPKELAREFVESYSAVRFGGVSGENVLERLNEMLTELEDHKV